VYVVTSTEYRDTVQAQLPQLTPQQILLEPVRRNTAPCIAYACYKIGLKNPDANLVVAPADHIILKEEEFVKTIETALAATAKDDILVTLGIKPSRPDTGYGYIQYLPGRKTIKKVKTFTEKPYLELAQQFLESGDYVWNAGIFVWNVKAISRNFELHMSDVAELFEDGKNHFYRDDEEAVIRKVYSSSRTFLSTSASWKRPARYTWC
jgi:mannose-1-phosphate guanylyltransferase